MQWARNGARLVLSAVLAIAPAVQAASQSIVTDGRSATSLTTTGTTTDITTGTVAGGYGVNSFAQFGVGAGAIVNMHVPGGAVGTVNIVNGPRSVINGTVQSLQGGAVGGEMYLANPNGFTVGADGRVVGTSIGLSTPTQGFVDGFFGADGTPNSGHVAKVVAGTDPQAAGGIDISGQIAASQSVRLTTGGDITISGGVTAGDRASQMAAAVNMGPGVSIRAGGNVRLSPGAQITAANGDHGGQIDVRAVGTIRVDTGAFVSADGIGAGDGGVAILFADDAAYLSAGAVVSAVAQGSGTGGFVEFSSHERVAMAGDLRAWSVQGEGGVVLIDPPEVEFTENFYYGGNGTYLVQASEQITVYEGVVISTRQILGTDHFLDASTADSANLRFEAPAIDVRAGAAILTFADSGFAGGSIRLLADDSGAINPTGSASISVIGALLRGNDIILRSTVVKDNIYATPTAVTDYVADTFGATGIAAIDGLIGRATSAADSTVANALSGIDALNLPAYVTAEATTHVGRSYIVADGDVEISASATTTMQINAPNSSLAVALAYSKTVAESIVQESQVQSGGDLTIRALTNETVDLHAGGNSGASDANLALAASFRENRAQALVYGTTYSVPEVAGVDKQDFSTRSRGTTDIIARADKDIVLDARSGGNDEGKGEAFALSVEDSVVQAFSGALHVTQDKSLTLSADTVYARNLLTAATGDVDLPDPPAGSGAATSASLDGLRAGLTSALSLGGLIDGASVVVELSDTKTSAMFGTDQIFPNIVTGGDWYGSSGTFSPIAQNSGALAGDDTTLTLHATTDLGDTRLFAAIDSPGGDGATRGGTAIIAKQSRETNADHNFSLLFGAPDVDISAELTGTLELEQSAASGNEVEFSFGHLSTIWITRAGSSGQFGGVGDFSVLAHEDVAVSNVQKAVSNPGNSAGTLGFAVTNYSSIVEAFVYNTFIYDSKMLPFVVRAESESTIETQAFRNGDVTGDAGSATSGAAAFVNSTGSVSASIINSGIVAERITVEAIDRTWRQTVANAAGTTPSGRSILGAMVMDTYLRSTTAHIDANFSDYDDLGQVIGVEDDIVVSALSETAATVVSIGRATGDEGIGIAGLFALLKDDRDVIAELASSDGLVGGDVIITADRDDSIIVVQGTEASSTSGVGIAVVDVLLGGATRAEAVLSVFQFVLDGEGEGGLGEVESSTVNISGDLTITATHASKALALSLGAGSTNSYGGIGSVAYLNLGRLPDDTPISDITDILLDDGVQAEETARTEADNARAEMASTLVSAAALGGLDMNADDPRATEVLARLAVEGGEIFVDGDLAVTAVDARRGTAIAGQLQAGLVTDAIGIFDKYFSIDDISANGVSLSLRPTSVGAAVGTATDIITTGIKSAFALDDFSNAISNGGTFKTDSTTAGGAVAVTLIGGAVSSVVDLTKVTDYLYLAGTVNVAGTVAVASRNTAQARSFGLGFQIGANGAGASVSFARLQQATSSLVTGGALFGNSVAVTARTTGKTTVIGGVALVASGSAAVGATVTLTDLDAATVAEVVDASVESGGGDLTISATDLSDALVLSLAGGGAAGFGSVFGAITALSQRAIVRAQALNSYLMATGDISVSALSDTTTNAITAQLTIGSNLAVGAAISDVSLAGVTEARVDGSVLTTSNLSADISVTAESTRDAGIAAAGAAVGQGVGISGSISNLSREDVTRAQVHNGTLTASDSILVSALSDARYGALAGGDESVLAEIGTPTVSLAGGSTLGLGVSVAVVNSTSVTEALVTGNSLLDAQGSLSRDGVTGWARSGTAADALLTTLAYQGVAVLADAYVDTSLLAMSATGAGTLAISVQVPVATLRDSVTAAIRNTGALTPQVDAERDVTVLAGNATDVRFLSLIAQGAGAVAGGVDLESLVLDKTTEAMIQDASITTGNDISISAVSPDTITTWSAALSGAGEVSVAGVVQSALTENFTRAVVSGGTLVAEGDLTILARAPRSIQQTAINGGVAGKVAAAGTVLVLVSQDEVIAEVADDTGSVIDVDDAVTITAEATQAVDSRVYNPSGAGFAALDAAILSLRAEQTVIARFGAGAVMTQDRARDLVVHATHTLEMDALVGNLTGAGLAIGGAILQIESGSTVLAEVGEDAIVRTTGLVDVVATAARAIDAQAAAIGGGAAVFQAAATRLNFGRSTLDGELDGNFDVLAADLTDADAFSASGLGFDSGDARTASVLAQASAARAGIAASFSTLPSDIVTARIARRADVQTGVLLSVSARETGIVDLLSGGASLGTGAFSAGVTKLRAATNVEVDVEAFASLVALGGEVRLSATSDLDAGNQRALAGSAGYVAGTGAVVEAFAERSLRIDVDAGAVIGGLASSTTDVVLTASETGALGSNADGLGFGVVAAAGVFATTRNTSVVAIDFAASGTAPVIRGDDVTISAMRDGAVTAEGLGISLGVLSGAGVDVAAIDASSVSVALGRAVIEAGDRVDIAATSRAEVDAKANGVNISQFGTVGFTLAKAERTAVVAVTATDTDIVARDLAIEAIDAVGQSNVDGVISTITASTVSASGGAVSLGGSVTTVINTPDIATNLTFGKLDITNDATILAASNSYSSGSSTGLSFAFIGLGTSRSYVTVASTVLAEVKLTGEASIGNDFTLLADGHEATESKVTSGKGEIYSVDASRSEIDLDADTTATLDAGAEMVVGGMLRLDTAREVEFANEGDSYSAVFAGYGGTRILNDISSASEIGVTGSVVAGQVAIGALTDISKTEQGYSGAVGSIGAISGTSLRSETIVTNTTVIGLDDGADITQTGTPGFGLNGVDIDITAIYDLKDSVKIDTGGGIAFPTARSLIAIEAPDLRIALDGAQIRADGDIDLSILSDVDASTEAYVNVYGLAGVPFAEVETSYDAVQSVDLTGSALLRSNKGRVVIGAGSDASGGQNIDLSSELRVWNATAFPIIRNPVAVSKSVQQNLIGVGPDARILAAEDVRLNTGVGSLDLYSFGSASDLYRETGEAVTNFFGSIVGADEVTLDIEVGTVVNQSVNGVTVDGRVSAGHNAYQSLVAGQSGIISLSDGIDAEIIEDVDIRAELEATLAALETDLASAGNDAVLSQRLTSEIARLTRLLAELGSSTIDLLRVNSAYAAAGDIEVSGDFLTGAGTVIANGDATISIFNDGPRVVEVVDLTIPFIGGGLITLNDIAVTTQSELATILAAARTSKSLDYAGKTIAQIGLTVDASAAGGAPAPTLISVENTYSSGTGVSGDIYVTGAISNLRGRVSLYTADGNIMVLGGLDADGGGSIEAAEVEISSGGDFFLSAGYNDLLTNLPDSPFARFAPVFAAAQEGSYSLDLCFDATCDGYVVPPTSGGSITAGGGVYIYANNHVNITGLLQSGVTDFTLTIDESLNTLLSRVSLRDPVSVLYSPAGNGTTLGEGSALPGGIPYIDGNVLVRYDREAELLLIDPIVAKGGDIEIVGQIISTGGGTLSAASGYAHVNVVNDSNYAMVFDTISTGYDDGATGVIRLIDLARPGVNGQGFVTTEYSEAPNGSITRTVYNNALFAPAVVTIDVDPVYEIDKPWRVLYYSGDIVTRLDGTYEFADVPGNEQVIIESQLEFGISIPGSSGIATTSYGTLNRSVLSTELRSEEKVVNADDPEFLAAVEQAFAGAGVVDIIRDSDYILIEGGLIEYNFPVETIYSDWAPIGTPNSYQRLRVTTRTEANYDMHVVAADKDIAIGFHGYDDSALTITSASDVIFDGSVYNRMGLTTVISGGSILANSGANAFEVNKLVLDAAGDIGQTQSFDSSRGVTLGNIGPQSGGIGQQTSFVNSIASTNLASFKIDQADGYGLDATAGGTIKIKEISGDMELLSVAAVDEVILTTAGSILKHRLAPNTALVSADAITLTAQSGAIGTLSDPISLFTEQLSAAAAFDINLLAVDDRDLKLGSVVSQAGDVSIIALQSSILDRNAIETIDRRADAGLLDDLWDSLGLRATDSSGAAETARQADLIAAYEAAETARYFEYWNARLDIGSGVGGEAVLQGIRDYSASDRIEPSAVQRAAYLTLGITDAEIDALGDAATARFHQLHAEFGSTGYDATYRATASAETIAALSVGLHRTDSQLSRGLRKSLVLGAGSVTVSEAPNVVGNNVNLAAAGSIGRQRVDLVIDPAVGLTQEALDELWSAAPEDIATVGGLIRVERRSDLDVVAAGHLIALAAEDVLIGSDADLSVLSVFGNGEVRLETTGALRMAAGSGANPVTGQTIVLDAGAGGIGAAGAPLLVTQLAGGSIIARSAGDVRLTAPTSDLTLANVTSEAGVVIAAAGSILNGSDATSVRAHDVALLAAGAIGSAAAPLGVALTDDAGNLSAVALGGDLTLDVTERGATAGLIGSTSGNATLRVLMGDLMLAGLSDPDLAALLLGDDPIADVSLSGVTDTVDTLNSGGTAAGILGANPSAAATDAFVADLRTRFGGTALPVAGLGLVPVENARAALATGLPQIGAQSVAAPAAPAFAALPSLNAGGLLTLYVQGDVTGREGLALDMAAVVGADLTIGGNFGSNDAYIISNFDNGDNRTDGATLVLRDASPGDGMPPSAHLLNLAALDVRGVELARAGSEARIIALGDIALASGARLRGSSLGFAALDDPDLSASSGISFADDVDLRADSLTLLAQGVVTFEGSSGLVLESDLAVVADVILGEAGCSACGTLTVVGDHDLRILAQRRIALDQIIATEGFVSLNITDLGGITLETLHADRAVLTTVLGNVEIADASGGDLTIRANGSVADSRYAMTRSLDVEALAIGDSIDARAIVVGNPDQVRLTGQLGVFAAFQDAVSYSLDHLETGAQGLGIDLIATSTGQGALTLSEVISGGTQVTLSADQLTLAGNMTTQGGDATLRATNGAFRQTLGTSLDAGTGHISVTATGDMSITQLLSYGADADAPMISLSTPEGITGIGPGTHVAAAFLPGALVRIAAGGIANVGPSGLWVEASVLDMVVASGDLHLISTAPVTTIANLRNLGGGLVDYLTLGSFVLDGAVIESADAFGTARGEVSLVATTSSITGTAELVRADHLTLLSFGGAIGSDTAPLRVETADVALLSAGAQGLIDLDFGNGEMVADYVLSETGAVTLGAPDTVSVAGLGAGGDVTVTSADLLVTLLTAGTTQDTRPVDPFRISPASYRTLIAGQAGAVSLIDTDGGFVGGGTGGAPIVVPGAALVRRPIASGFLTGPSGASLARSLFAAQTVNTPGGTSRGLLGRGGSVQILGLSSVFAEAESP